MMKSNISDTMKVMLENVTGKIPIPKTDNVFRHEYKFIIDRYEFSKCSRICKKYMSYDNFCDENGKYYIGSLYFDSINDKDYFDKELGAFDRKKIRIRSYGHDLNWANLEIKRKVDIWEYKNKIKLNPYQIQSLSNGDFSPLLMIGTESAIKFYITLTEGLYRPSCIVEYERTAFMLPFEDIRITFDEDVRCSLTNFDLFKEKVMTPLIPDGHVVFEIKYNEYLPKWVKNMLSKMRISSEAVSKYAIARQYNL